MRISLTLNKTVAILCLFLALLTACGQRGPLYLPNKSDTSAPKQEPQPADDQKTKPAKVKHGSEH